MAGIEQTAGAVQPPFECASKLTHETQGLLTTDPQLTVCADTLPPDMLECICALRVAIPPRKPLRSRKQQRRKRWQHQWWQHAESAFTPIHYAAQKYQVVSAVQCVGSGGGLDNCTFRSRMGRSIHLAAHDNLMVVDSVSVLG